MKAELFGPLGAYIPSISQNKSLGIHKPHPLQIILEKYQSTGLTVPDNQHVINIEYQQNVDSEPMRFVFVHNPQVLNGNYFYLKT